MTYSVEDRSAGTRVIKENLKLKPRKYKARGADLSLLAEHTYQFFVRAVFRATNTHRDVKATYTDTFSVPVDSVLSTLGLPACAV